MTGVHTTEVEYVGPSMAGTMTLITTVAQPGLMGVSLTDFVPNLRGQKS